MLSSVRTLQGCGRSMAFRSAKFYASPGRVPRSPYQPQAYTFSSFRPQCSQNRKPLSSVSPLRTILLATTAGVAGPLWLQKPVACEGFMGRKQPLDVATEIDAAMRQNQINDEQASKALFHKGELTFGAFLGFCTGYLIKKVGKLFALAVGTGFIFLQYMSVKGFITVHWDRLEGGYRKQLDVDKDGKVTKRDVNSKWQSFMGFLTHNIQFKSTFMIGFYAGARYG